MERYSAVRDVIRSRRTFKLLGDPRNPQVYPHEIVARCDAVVTAAIADAGWAPFHYDRRCDGVAEPWRFYVAFHADCRRLAQRLPQWASGKQKSGKQKLGKIPNLLSGCGAVVLVTWLPEDGSTDNGKGSLQQVNEEHLAATSAAVQNLLLLLTAAGLETYWSSGGALSDPLVWERLGINSHQRLVAAVFVGYPDGLWPLEKATGKMRSRRADAASWSRQLRVEQEC